MKSDLDRLMQDRDLNALVVTGGGEHNAHLHYMTNGAHITGGLLLKKTGADPVLIVNPMEIEEAAASGLQVLTYYDLDWARLMQDAQGDADKAEIGIWGAVLRHFDVPPGRVAIYGFGELNRYLNLAERLRAALPDYTFTGDSGVTLFDEAMRTKDADELARMQSVAQRTSAVLQATWDFIASHHADGETVVNADGAPLTIGAVKRFVIGQLLARDLEDTAMIFAQGRDAGFPHSRGQAAMPLQIGQAIVFDLFPREAGGGYHHDCTRTWCIGHAPDEVQAAYDEVLAAFQVVLDAYGEPGQPYHTLQDAVMDAFEAQGHPTQRSQPGTSTGYVHSLGHGLGLEIHERPSISHLRKTDVVEVGNVITIEPGLYYPERGFGIRVEDTFYIDEAGQLVGLTDFHKDLVLPLRGE